jgi:hypothetical protein
MCTTSPEINSLAEALAKAQGVIQTAKFDGVNPFFSTKERQAKYATLAQVWESCRKPLSDNGLCVVQPVDVCEAGVTIRTRLIHASGQWIESALTMPVEKKNAQGVGSAITYGRRYGLSAMVGIVADEDDDGNAAAVAAPVEEVKPKSAARQVAKAHGMKTGDEIKPTWEAELKGAATFDTLADLIRKTDGMDLSAAEKQARYLGCYRKMLDIGDTLNKAQAGKLAASISAKRTTNLIEQGPYLELIKEADAILDRFNAEAVA